MLNRRWLMILRGASPKLKRGRIDSVSDRKDYVLERAIKF